MVSPSEQVEARGWMAAAEGWMGSGVRFCSICGVCGWELWFNNYENTPDKLAVSIFLLYTA